MQGEVMVRFSGAPGGYESRAPVGAKQNKQ